MLLKPIAVFSCRLLGFAGVIYIHAQNDDIVQPRWNYVALVALHSVYVLFWNEVVVLFGACPVPDISLRLI